MRDDDDDDDDGDDDDDDDDDDDVIFVEGTPKQKTGQMDSLTPF